MASQKETLFRRPTTADRNDSKKDGDGSKPEPMKNVEEPSGRGGEGRPMPSGTETSRGPGGPMARTIMKHHAERQRLHEKHRAKRRDLHGHVRDLHDKLHQETVDDHEEMASRHQQEMAQAEAEEAQASQAAPAAPGPAMGAQPAAGGTPTAPA
jgi:hypothetical protein